MAEIKYKISGQSDTTAIAKTQLAMKKLGSEVKNLNRVIGGFAIAKVMQGVAKVTNGATEAFLSQNKALQQYNATVTKFGKSLSNLNKIQNEVSRNNFFDSDSINNATKMAVAMGLSEKQIKEVLKSSTDLAASGVMPLDQAVKALSLTYSGNISQLKRMNPELAKLTKEQLEQGEAVRIIGQEYKGMADAMSNTFDGRNTQWKNSFSDLQAEVGEILQKVKFFGEGKWLDPLNKITNWLNDNSSKIASFIVSIPSNFKIAFNAIKDIIKELFSVDFWSKNGQLIVEIFYETFIAVKDTVTEIMATLMKSLGELVKLTAANLGKSLISGMFGDLGKFGVDVLYRAGIINQDSYASWWNGIDDKVDVLDNKIEEWKKDNDITTSGTFSKIAEYWKDSSKNITNSVSGTTKTIATLLNKIDSTIDETVGKATRDINENVTENISNVEPSQDNIIPQFTVAAESPAPSTLPASASNTSNVFVQWKISADNLLKNLFPKIIDKVRDISLNAGSKVLDIQIKTLKEADIYNGVDHKQSIKALETAKSFLESFAAGDYYSFDDKGNKAKGKKWSVAKQIDFALGTRIAVAHNEKHPDNSWPIINTFSQHLKNFINNVDFSIFKSIAGIFRDNEDTLKDWFKSIKEFTKSTREVVGKVTGDLLATVGNSLINGSGQIGNYINAGIQGAEAGGGYGAVFAVIAQLLSDIIQIVSEKSASFQVFLNFISNILESLITEIVPIFDEFVKPFFEGFSAVKEILSGIIYALGSLIGWFTEIFKMFTQTLNIIASSVSGIFKIIGGIYEIFRGFIQVLQPILEGLSYVTRTIAAAIYSVEWVIVQGINAVIRALNQIPWVSISQISGFDDYESAVADIWNGGGNTEDDNNYLNSLVAQSASNITGASASYTAARDIYLTINYDHSYVNGDARDIAINLYNELKDAQKLNLIA